MYEKAVIFVNKVEDMPIIVNKLLLNSIYMNQLSQNNIRFIIQKVNKIYICLFIN